MSSPFAVRWPNQPASVEAAFTLRTNGTSAGGASRGPYAAFNVAAHVGDDPSAVDTNRGQLRALLSLPSEPVWLRQVHGRRVIDAGEGGGEADAAVTQHGGVVCAVQVADCLPVLFAAIDGSRVGAAHAGWRGLAAGVLEETIAALELAPSRLAVWIGAAICQKHFEVGGEVRSVFVEGSSNASSAFVANERGRWQCDLPRLAADRLRAAGVSSIDVAPDCTVCDAGRFFSYRRDGICGRMAALIWKG